jgi:hypothetical protein
VRIRYKDLYHWKQKMAQRSRSLQSLRKLPSDWVEHQLENRFPIDTSKVAIPNTAHWTRTTVQARARTYRQEKLVYPMFDAAEKDSQGSWVSSAPVNQLGQRHPSIWNSTNAGG